jgi:hypothetical protein
MAWKGNQPDNRHGSHQRDVNDLNISPRIKWRHLPREGEVNLPPEVDTYQVMVARSGYLKGITFHIALGNESTDKASSLASVASIPSPSAPPSPASPVSWIQEIRKPPWMPYEDGFENLTAGVSRELWIK